MKENYSTDIRCRERITKEKTTL